MQMGTSDEGSRSVWGVNCSCYSICMVFGDTRESGKALSSSAFFYEHMIKAMKFLLNRKEFGYVLSLASLVFLLASCAAPTYLSPNMDSAYLVNKGNFSVLNLDQNAKIEPQSLTAHYEGFDIHYKLVEGFVPTLEIVNNSNKSLIIDKAKCFVLYNGYSRDLFKDVRSSRSTTFNNVQDAINNVQTSDASVIMTIPPYSKWELPLAETNVKNIENVPDFIDKEGRYPIQAFDNPQPVEFVIPYSFDYALTKWDTSRNRLYVGQVEVYTQDYPTPFVPNLSNSTSYFFGKEVISLSGNKDEVDRVNTENIRRWKSHRHKINASHIIWSIILSPTVFVPALVPFVNAVCKDQHKPIIYNSDGTSAGKYDKKNNYKSKY